MNFLKLLLLLLFASIILEAANLQKVFRDKRAKIQVYTEAPISIGTNTFKLNIKLKKRDPKRPIISVKVITSEMSVLEREKHTYIAQYNPQTKRYFINVNITRHGTWSIHVNVKPSNSGVIFVKTSVRI